MSDQHTSSVNNRSELVFLYDAVDANPNGNPLSGADRPRIDPRTQQAVVTDVRLKRYLRDQLEDDGHGVYIRNVKEDGDSYTREQLLKDRLDELEYDEIPDEDLQSKVYDTLLNNSVDIRYFGATMSVSGDDDLLEHLPDHFTGPVQFSPGKTLHAVNENENYNSLTSVIATQEDKEQGGFDLDDYRIQYGLIGFHGLVDEHAAEETHLSEEDVRRLDTLLWRAIKNQTISRSKVGQEPRLYLRVEYETDSFHIGGLTRDLELDDDRSLPDDELRSCRDLAIRVDTLLERLEEHRSQIDTVHVHASDVLPIVSGNEDGDHSFLYEELVDTLGEDAVRPIDVYEEYRETRPE